jgi:hypothetical protein
MVWVFKDPINIYQWDMKIIVYCDRIFFSWKVTLLYVHVYNYARINLYFGPESAVLWQMHLQAACLQPGIREECKCLEGSCMIVTVSPVYLKTYVCVLTTVYHLCHQSPVTMEVLYILKSNPHPFYSFRGLKNQMRIRFAVKSWILEK